MSLLVYGLEVIFFYRKDNIEEQIDTILQGLMMVSIHGPNDSEFAFRTAMNIWGKTEKETYLS